MRFTTGVLLGLATTGVAAQQVTFSLASDEDSNNPVFAGFGSSLVDVAGSNESFSLLVDDANGPLPTLEFIRLTVEADFELTYIGSTEIAPGFYTHQYFADGTFAFDTISTGAGPLLTAEVSGAVLTAVGGEDFWASPATLGASDFAQAEITYTWGGDDFADYGLFNGATSVVDGADDGAFTLTLLGNDFGSGVQLGTDGLPADGFVSEASFSGSATFVPAPGTAALLACGAGIGLRRRR